jgi:hypothetical protein
MERSSGALGDLNGDGQLETVDITTFVRKSASDDQYRFTVHAVLTCFPIVRQSATIPIIAHYQNDLSNDQLNADLIRRLSLDEQLDKASLDQVTVLRQQTWNSYLGRQANSHYERPAHA